MNASRSRAKRPPRPDAAVPAWRCCDVTLLCGLRPLVMGVLNVTPDSFSDGGRFASARAAITRAREMLDEGADIIDIGGESTRPGAEPVGAREEIRRVLPVVEQVCDAIRSSGSKALVSIDTTKGAVARAALKAGARIINDVSALSFDSRMARLAAESGAGVVLMHMKGRPRTMQKSPAYSDVVAEVTGFLASHMKALARRGVPVGQMAVDPGIGFGKTLRHNLELVACLRTLVELGRPVVAGVSRKRFIGAVTGRGVDERFAGSIAAATLCAANGAHVVRAHDVGATRDAMRVVGSVRAAIAVRGS